MIVWTKEANGTGWTTHRRGNCRVVVSPSGALVTLYAPACTTMHTSVNAAKSAAKTRMNCGW